MKLYKVYLTMILILIVLVFNPQEKPSINYYCPQKSSAIVSFDYSIKEIIVEAYINGKGPFNLMIDTGIYPSMISLEAAEILGLKLGRSPGSVLGIAGSRNNPYYPISLNKVKVGDYSAKRLEAIAVNMAHFSNDSLKLHGVLGYSFLKDLITRIDYKNKQIEFCQESITGGLSRKPSGKYHVSLPLDLAGGKIPVLNEVYVNGEKISAWLDTGSNTALTLSKNTYRRLSLKENEDEGVKVTATGTKGSIELKIAEAETIQLGPFIQDSVLVVAFNSGGQNLLGNPFFEKYILTLDYINGWVFIEK